MTLKHHHLQLAASALLAGVVLNMLVAWGIGLSGVTLGNAAFKYFRVGDQTVEVREFRNPASRVLVWDVTDPRRAAVGQYMRDHNLQSFRRSAAWEPNLRYDPIQTLPAWATFADPQRLPPPLPPPT